ncbi:hypothetical protein, partial [Pseudomonas juntendi]|uniref:hypothetical protein n=1 Tax=Pseudomonas juntendi TaxID=2666183 RepID=UPI003B92546D
FQSAQWAKLGQFSVSGNTYAYSLASLRPIVIGLGRTIALSEWINPLHQSVTGLENKFYGPQISIS